MTSAAIGRVNKIALLAEAKRYLPNNNWFEAEIEVG